MAGIAAPSRLDSSRISPFKAPLPALLSGAQAEKFVKDMRDWNFGEGGVFKRAEEMRGDLLFHTATQAVHHFGLCEKLNIKREKFHNWVWSVQAAMKSETEVPYHNATHVTDVLHAAWWFLVEADLAAHMTPQASLSLMLAAIAHDCGHPGLNNTWWNGTKSELALTYHGRSVLENYHIRESMRLIKHDECNLFDGVDPADEATVCEFFIDAVLSTDLALHDDVVERFAALVEAGGDFSKGKAEQKVLVMMALKASDIANPSKRWSVYRPWIDRLFVEFYSQGDKERTLGMVPQPHMDRKGSKPPPAAQIGFISYIMKPLFEQWSAFLPKVKPHLEAIDESLRELKVWLEGLPKS